MISGNMISSKTYQEGYHQKGNLLLSKFHIRASIPMSKIFKVDALEVQSLGSESADFLAK